MKSNRISSYLASVSKNRLRYEEFTKKLQALLDQLLREEGVEFYHLECRTKTIESISAKIRSKPYTEPEKELCDIVGIRVIVYYLDDVARVSNIVEREFLIDRKNSIDKKQVLRPDQFGYLSVQYVVSLRPQRYLLPEWKEHKTFKAEIQIRTLPQHAWAVIDRKLRYKRNEEVPPHLLRRIFRIAGLLELVDQEFQAIRDDSTRLLEVYPSTPVNAGTLASYYQSAPTAIQVRGEAYKAGFAEDEEDLANIDELISTCGRSGIRTISDLERFLSGLNDLRMTFFKEIVARAGKQKWKAGAILVTLMLLYGRFPRKFTMGYLTGRGWNQQTVRTIRTCANRSTLNGRR